MKRVCFEKYHYYLPQTITASRILLTILFFYLYFMDLLALAIICFTLAVITDIIDGIIARKLGVCSIFGSYFDFTADFLLIIIVFIAFVLNGIYPIWFIFLIGFMFFQFIITSRLKKIIYDPVGKYLFLILIIIVFITFISDETSICSINCVVFSGFSIASLISRFKNLKELPALDKKPE
ncbi:MAG: CDP-alcohol phosphatidyltransferase family protein [Candidatus Thorarchaeota archaeon]